MWASEQRGRNEMYAATWVLLYEGKCSIKYVCMYVYMVENKSNFFLLQKVGEKVNTFSEFESSSEEEAKAKARDFQQLL